MPHNETRWARRQRTRRITAAERGFFDPPAPKRGVIDPNLVAALHKKKAAAKSNAGPVNTLKRALGMGV